MNDLVKNHPESTDPVYYAYYDKNKEHTWENIIWTNKEVATIDNLEKFITLTSGVFDLNPDLKHLEEL